MLPLILFILITYGTTDILTAGRIFDGVRPKYYFFHCPMCVGFHVGWVLYLSFFFFQPEFLFMGDHPSAFFYAGAISSGTSYVLCKLFGDEGLKISHQEVKHDK